MMHGCKYADDGGIFAQFAIDEESICEGMLDALAGRECHRTIGYVRSHSTRGKWKAIQWVQKAAQMLVVDVSMTEALGSLTGDPTRVVGELVDLGARRDA